MKRRIRSTTVICVRRDGKVVMAGDGQVTLGSEVLKGTAKKLRRLYNDKIVAGFAGSTADAFALFSRFETKLEQFNGNLARSVVELAKEWRTDRALRHLEALLLVADTASTGGVMARLFEVARNWARFWKRMAPLFVRLRKLGSEVFQNMLGEPMFNSPSSDVAPLA